MSTILLIRVIVWEKGKQRDKKKTLCTIVKWMTVWTTAKRQCQTRQLHPNHLHPFWKTQRTHCIALIYSNYLAMALITLGCIDDTIRMHLRCHFSEKHTQTKFGHLLLLISIIIAFQAFEQCQTISTPSRTDRRQTMKWRTCNIHEMGWLNVF